ncbi:MAG TPA: hypothetical protein VGL93_30020 [Streptosporangiaceae bacterium]|jgi:hypothetical protein
MGLFGNRRREVIPQAAQAWIGDTAIAFGARDGDVAELAVHGDQVEYHVVRAPLRQVVRAGPFDVRVTGFGYEGGREVVRVTVSPRRG